MVWKTRKIPLKIAYVDHAAYDIYRFKNFDLVVTVGDDTTLVASDILYRFDIPIIGITDGDLDKVVEKGFVNDKSIILEVAPDFDDIVGHNIHERLFHPILFLKFLMKRISIMWMILKGFF